MSITEQQRAEIVRRGQASMRGIGELIAKFDRAKIQGSMDWQQAVILAEVITAPKEPVLVDVAVSDDAEPVEVSPHRAHRSRAPPNESAASSAKGRGANSSETKTPTHKSFTGAKRKKQESPKVTVMLGRECVGFITTVRPFAAFDIDGRPIAGLFPTRCSAIAAILEGRFGEKGAVRS